MSFFIRRIPLDVETAAVEAHALADQRDLRMRGIAPSEFDQARLAALRRRLSDRMDHRIAAFEVAASGDGDGRAMRFAQRLCFGGQFGWAEIGGGGVDEVTDAGGGGGLPQCFVDLRRVA
jgi:hypothetical protein